MTKEKNGLLNILLVEGILTLALGVIMVLMPQLSSLAAAVFASLTLVIYGVYKFIHAIVIRKYINHFIVDMIVGLMLIVIGIYLFMHPTLNLLILTSIVGVFFLVESLNTTAVALQIKKFIKSWWVYLFSALMQFGLSMIILLGLPLTALWAIGLLLGINFVFGGMTMLVAYMSTIYIKDDFYKERV